MDSYIESCMESCLISTKVKPVSTLSTTSSSGSPQSNVHQSRQLTTFSIVRTKALQQSNLKRRTMMKLAFKVGEGGNEEGVREIEDLADEDSADEEGDMEVEEEKKEEAEEAAKPGFLRRARNKCANGRRTVSGMIGTRMTNSEVC